jgi:hypothetical protein
MESMDGNKPEIHKITVTIERRSPRYPEGKTTPAGYIFVDGVVTLVDPQGAPVRDPHGSMYRHKIEPGDAGPEDIARVLARRLHNVIHGKPADIGERVKRPLQYRKLGLW